MSKHSGGKVRKAGKTLTSKRSSAKEKSKAGKVLKKHLDEKH
ncbi:hypothetical protein [Ureibacillus sp. FSL E2-3493]